MQRTDVKQQAEPTVSEEAPQYSPSEKAHYTAKWARTMTKWLITRNHKKGAKWKVLDFCGKNGSEAVGIVDLMAIRKNYRDEGFGHKRGDLFEIVLIQTKGGSAPAPSKKDMQRLSLVAQRYGAKAVLSVWCRKEKFDLFELDGKKWTPVSAKEIFGC